MLDNVLDPYLRQQQEPETYTETSTDTVAAKEEERMKRKEEEKKEEEESKPRLNDSVPSFDEELGGNFVRDRRNQTERGREQMRRADGWSREKKSGKNKELEDGESWEGAAGRFRTVIVRDPDLNHQKRYDIVRKVQGRKRKSNGGARAAKRRRIAAENSFSASNASSVRDLRELLTPLPASNVTPPATPTRRQPTTPPRRSRPPSRPAVPSAVNITPSSGAIQKTGPPRQRSPSPDSSTDVSTFVPESFGTEKRLRAAWKTACLRYRQHRFSKKKISFNARVNTEDFARWLDDHFGKYKDENRKLAREAFGVAHRQHLNRIRAEKEKKKEEEKRGRERSAMAKFHQEVVDANVEHLRERDAKIERDRKECVRRLKELQKEKEEEDAREKAKITKELFAFEKRIQKLDDAAASTSGTQPQRSTPVSSSATPTVRRRAEEEDEEEEESEEEAMEGDYVSMEE